MKRTAFALGSALVLACSFPLRAEPPIHAVSQLQTGTVLHWQSDFAHAAANLRIAGPNGVVEQKFGSEAVQLAINPSAMADGSYTFELTLISSLPPAGLARDVVRTPPQVAQMTGNFRILGGVLYTAAGGPEAPAGKRGGASVAGEARTASTIGPKDVVVPDDQIVQGSLCVGLDCVNNESFGFDTVRLKENNTRLKFNDTSVSVGFPANNWQLTANDSASGGADKFSVEDITGAKIPFTLTAGAPTNSMFVASNGKVGFRTAVPVLDLHMVTGDTPAWRLEQTGASGFSPQTWDVAGNEANFFVRDTTAGSRLPFRIRPGAPTSSIDIAANGNVGIGVALPLQPVHLRRSDGTAQLLVEEASSTTLTRTVASFVNNGDVKLSFGSTGAPVTTWETTAGAGGFRIGIAGAGTPQMTLAANGNLNITGALTQASSVTLKENIVPVNAESLLRAIAQLPIYTWNYLRSPSSERHLGPTAEDFHRMFALGNNPLAIAPGDLAGVALGAIQALNQALADKDRELTDLRERMSALEKLVIGAGR